MYKQNDHLWNKSSPVFRNGSLRATTYQQMSNQLNVPVKNVQSKVQGLRDVYKKLWRKCQEGGVEREIKWRYYENMRFLDSSFEAEKKAQQQRLKIVGRRSPVSKRHSSLIMRHSRHSQQTPTSSPAPPAINTLNSDEFLGFPSANNSEEVQEIETECDPSDEEDIDDGNESDCSVYVACGSKMVAPKFENEELVTTSTPTAWPVPLPQTPQHQQIPQPQQQSQERSHAPPSTPHQNASQYTQPLPPNSDRIYGFFQSMADTVKTFPPRIIAEVKLHLSTMIGQIELQLASGEEVYFGNNSATE